MLIANRAIRKIIRRIEKSVGSTRAYDRKQNAEAQRAYRAIVTQAPERALPPSEIRKIKEYARTVLGNECYAPWLITYSAFRGAFFEGWLPDNYVGRYLIPYSAGSYRVYGSRTLGARLFQTDLFPDIAYRIRGAFYEKDLEPIAPDRLLNRVFADHPTVYVKQEGTERGVGVRKADRNNFESIVGEMPADLVVQRPLGQAPFFTEFSPNAAATLRLTTARDEKGAVEVRAAFLRLGRERDVVVGAATSIDVAIDRSTGCMHDYGVLQDWTRTGRHPDTGAAFSNKTIPLFGEAVEVVQSLHARAPHVLLLGWDVCITADEGVRLFEVNAGHSDVKFSEAATGPIFTGLGWDRLHRRQ